MSQIKSKAKKPKRTTITVRLSEEERAQLERACKLHRMSQTKYLTRLAMERTRQDLLDHAVKKYQAGQASLSELSRETGLDVPAIMDALALRDSPSKKAVDAFLAEARALSKRLKDPEFFEMAKSAVGQSPEEAA